MTDFRLRAMEESERAEVAELVSVSMNTWDVLHGMPGRFFAGAQQTALFCQVYEKLDPGHTLVAEAGNGRLASPAKAMSSISQPFPRPLASEPMRKRTRTVWPA